MKIGLFLRDFFVGSADRFTGRQTLESLRLEQRLEQRISPRSPRVRLLSSVNIGRQVNVLFLPAVVLLRQVICLLDRRFDFHTGTFTLRGYRQTPAGNSSRYLMF